MAGGWIKIYRNIQEHWIWQDPLKLKWWLDILLLANHQDNKFVLGNELMEIKQGQFHTSELKLAERWNVNRKTVRKFLDLLQQDGMIFIKKSRKLGTTIEVSNYKAYQAISQPQKDNQVDNGMDNGGDNGMDNRVDINKNDKNDKNVKKDKNIYIPLTFVDEVVDKVKITKEQYDNLINKFGEGLVHKNIIALDNYITNGKGKNYKDHYRALNTWCSKDKPSTEIKEQNKKPGNFDNFEQREYDYEDLEKKLLGWD